MSNVEKAKKVFARIGFSNKVFPLSYVMDNNNEICSCDSYLIGYEDKNGRECDSNGNYLNNEQ